MAKNAQRMVLVTGATGKQGGAVAQHLLKDGTFQVRAMTRDPSKDAARRLEKEGAQVIRGDLDDRKSLDAAVSGVYAVFSVQNFWETGYQREIDQGVRLADAAHAAGVQHFVYSSVGSAHRNTGLSHFESKWQIENHIRSLGLPHTIFRPVFFMDNWEAPGMADPILRGQLGLPLSPERSLQQVAVDDVGAFVLLALQSRDEWLGRAVDIAGEDRPMSDVARAFGQAIGRPVQYVQFPWDAFRQAMGDEYYHMMRWFEDVGYEADIPTLKRIHPDLIDLDRYLKDADWASRRPSEAAVTAG